MQVRFEDGTQALGDTVIRAVQRFDLTPIPSTIELIVRAEKATLPMLATGKVLQVGSSLDRYRILKVKKAPSEWQQSGGMAQPMQILGALDALADVGRRLVRAVVKTRVPMGEIYQACGASARVSVDIPVARFTCFAGEFPTVGLAYALQLEGAVAVWTKDKTLALRRLEELFTGLPVEVLEGDNTLATDSPYLETQEIPWGVSIDEAGQPIYGRRNESRQCIFVPRASTRELANLTRCLVIRRNTSGTFAGNLRAGDGIDIAGARHVITTVAHTWDTGAGGTAADLNSRLWLAQLSR